jgi:hypothetical protein
MKTRTLFAHRIEMLDAAGEIQEHLAGVEDYILAEAVWREAIARWPGATIILRQGARVVHDSRRACFPLGADKARPLPSCSSLRYACPPN